MFLDTRICLGTEVAARRIATEGGAEMGATTINKLRRADKSDDALQDFPEANSAGETGQTICKSP